MIKLPKDVKDIIKKLNENSFECYAVGGCVRDALLGLKPLDWDLTTNARLDDLIKIFPEAQILSEDYSVVRLDFTTSNDDDKNPIVDIATFRSENNFEKYGKPSEVTFVDKIEDDLSRRDFTVNAMADNPQRKFVDPYNGRADVKNKIVKIIGDPDVRFTEDPIRIMRGIRFAAEKGFTIEENTLEAMKRHAYRLMEVSAEKVRDEFKKIMAARFTSSGVKYMMDTGAINAICGDALNKLIGKKKLLLSLIHI